MARVIACAAERGIRPGQDVTQRLARRRWPILVVQIWVAAASKDVTHEKRTVSHHDPMIGTDAWHHGLAVD
jgi:hypothetical protein